MNMTVQEAFEMEVTAFEAKLEVEQHGCSFEDFQKEVGDKNSYSGEEVLGWLGY